MNEQTKSLIRHILTALGAVVGVIGLGSFSGAIDFILENLEGVAAAVTTIIGFAGAVLAFFKDGKRFEERKVK